MSRKNTTLKWGERTYVMGIINLTPDSFSGDGLIKGGDIADAALLEAQRFVHEGADIIDLGAESSRPGSDPVDAKTELARLIPALEAIVHADLDILLSIDTYKSRVAEETLRRGADWINDIWGLTADPDLGAVVAKYQSSIILMHNRSERKKVESSQKLGNRYTHMKYRDLIQDIISELQDSIKTARKHGIEKEKIIIDPGIGFGKSVEQNLELMRRLQSFKKMGYPLLIGPSRKSFIGYTLNLSPEDRLEGTAAAVAIGIANGADIVRVHDVKEMVRVAKMTDAIIRQ
ncbi:MAG TPA: dihydropteroate synthase [Anaerolineae bacterium]|nr:dihydropteroate synthase [Anaerolineae bacterium]